MTPDVRRAAEESRECDLMIGERASAECDTATKKSALSDLTPELSRTALRRRQSYDLSELCRRREAVSA